MSLLRITSSSTESTSESNQFAWGAEQAEADIERERQEAADEELDAAILRGDCFSTSPAKDIIRRALESIPDPS